MKAGVDYIGVAIGAFIVNGKGEVLLVKRSSNAKNEKGKWEAPGGEVEFGETLEHALHRELQEELGISVEIIEQFPTRDHILLEEKQHWVPTTFLVRLKKRQVPKIMEPEKHDEIGWFALDHFPKPLSAITQMNAEDYRKYVQ